MAAPAFSKQFNDKLKLHKYMRWAVNLSEDQLEALLCGIGEYDTRLLMPPQISDDQTSIVISCENGLRAGRMKVGLDVISRVARREDVNLEDVRSAVQRVVGEFYRRSNKPYLDSSDKRHIPSVDGSGGGI